MFVSRTNKYPSRMSSEKNSVMTSDNYDIVTFDYNFGKEDITGTYYISVYSFQYSTYSIVATVERDGKGLDQSIKEKTQKMTMALIESMPIRGAFQSQDGEELYKIEVKQLEGYEKPIKIQISPIEGKFRIIVSFGHLPTKTDFHW